MIISDDFASGSLGSVWTIAGPSGVSVGVGSNSTDGYLQLVTPAGSHDVWGTVDGARAMQAAPNTDFQLKTRFLTNPTQQFQMQGFLVQQDALNWLRFDTYFDGSVLRAFAAVTLNGSSSSRFSVAIPGNTAPYLRLTRTGNVWKFEYSQNGTTWTTAGSFTQALTVTAAGLFSANTGPSAGYTARVDYFENTATPIVNEDGTIVPVNVAPVAGNDTLSTPQNTPLTINVAADLLANDSDANGDVLNLASFTQPAHGTLINNGNGTLRYTPSSGFTGADSFTYVVSDGALTSTATVTLNVTSTTSPGGIVSDDFASGSLGSVWHVAGPSGTSAGVGSNSTDGYLQLVTPDGNYDVWGTDNGVRAMQAAPNTDFQLKTRFLTNPTQAYQMQGFLVEQDAQNWLRFDTYFDGSVLRAFAAVTLGGSSSSRLSVAIPGNSAPYLRLTRTGNVWKFEYSQNGTTWTTAGSFTQALTVTAAGLFSGNTGPALGYTARVDYFENTAAPIVNEDGTIVPVNVAPVAGNDTLSTPQNTPLTINVTADLLANDSDANGDVLNLASFTQPAHGALVNNGNGTLRYTPSSGFTGADSFTYVVSDGALTSTATVTLNVTSTTSPGGIVSDDFASGSLGSVWHVAGPSGTSAGVGSNSTDGYLQLVTPDGNYDVWGTDNGVRAMQAAPNTDFQLKTRFLTNPTQAYQMQGFLVEQDAQNWLRFDTYFDGSVLRAFAAVTLGGSSSSRLSVAIPGNSAPYLRLTRTGNVWKFEYSQNGTTWTTAGSFTQALTVTAAGLFSGNTGPALGYTARVDYFENTAAPIVNEDGTIVPVNVAPVAGNDTLSTPQNTPLTINVAADLLANDSDANGDVLNLASFTQPAHGTLINNGNGTLRYTPGSGFTGADSFTYVVSDGALTSTATVTLNVTSTTSPGGIVSDDFASGSLGSVWHVAGPSGTSAGVGSDGTDGYLQLVTPDGNYDVWGTDNGARAMQAAPNTDFQLKTRFLTNPTQAYQMQGFLVEQDAQNWLRFDTYFDGSVLRAFAAVTLGGSSSALINVAIPGNSAPYLRLTRTGNVWKFEYSQNGTTWTTAGSFTQTLTVTAAGLFSGNTGPAAGYTARVDYFENTAAPIVNEDGTIVPVNTIDVWYGPEQTFGIPGEAQQWINILGSVSGQVTSLSYSLNGGPPRALSMGPDTRRLQNPGDFNIDIAYSELDGSANDDVVTIREVMASGATFSRDVVIDYESGHTWAPNYSIHWESVTNIQDVAQILDGTWEIDNNGARPVDLGYDRLIAIGDRSWDNYELDLSITMHNLLNQDPRGRDAGGFAIGMLWTGHTDDPIAGWQPKSGWTPGAAFFYADDDRNGVGELTLHPSTSFAEIISSRSYSLVEGHTYDFRVRVEQTGLYDRLYSLKVWEEGTAEPAGWTLQGTESFGVSQAPATGSIYFDAHYFDVAFNDMSVSEIPGRDIVQGTSGNDLLSAPYSGNANEIDVFAGYNGADVFLLGDLNGDHYTVAGNADYGFIWDFHSGVDKIQLAGTAANYVLATNNAGLPTGTAIFHATAGGAPGELIGVLNGAQGLSLANSDFIFVGAKIA